MSDFDPFFGGDPDPDPEPAPAAGGPRPRRRPTGPTPTWVRARAASRPELSYVTVTQRRAHAFKKKPDRKPRCAVEGCNAGKMNRVHLGAPGSLNLGGSGGNHFIYQNTKKTWEALFTELLLEAELPLGLGYVYVDGVMGFPTRGRRDQGNFRYMVEKALGDALHDGGWLPDDDWLHYEFGRLALAYEKGQSWTSLTLYPEWDEKELGEWSGTSLLAGPPVSVLPSG